jgi:HAMP domain-containing protein
MVGIGAGLQAIAGPLRRRLPTLAALALVVVGLYAVAGRLRIPALQADEDLARAVAAGDADSLAEEAPCHTPDE